MERDILFSTHLTFEDFGPLGGLSWATLANLVGAFEQRSTSHLAAAMATDVELYESILDDEGNPPKRKPQPPQLTEVGLLESLMMSVVELLQANNHYSAEAKGKPKIQHIPRPLTASELYRRRQEKAAELDLLRLIGEA